MTCHCDDTKRKMPRCNAGTTPVLEVHSKECPVLFHTVTIPASIGDLESMPPTPGAHRNARVIYEADNVTYLYDSDGIPQLLVPDTESIIAEAVSQIPVATPGSNGLMSGADKAKLDGIDLTVEDFTSKVQFTDNPAQALFVRYGKMVWFYFQGGSKTHTALEVAFNIPSGYRPKAQAGSLGQVWDTGLYIGGGVAYPTGFYIDATTGDACPNLANSQTTRLYISGCYIIN